MYAITIPNPPNLARMWPWEHAIVGYLAYSLFARVVYRDPPGGLEAFAVVFASVLPDLIDKPLAWEFGVFETGYALGHSIFFAVPLAIVVGLVTRSYGRPRVGLAFGLGYLLHLPADVIDGYARGTGELHFGILLWPVVRGETYGHYHGFTDQFLHFFAQYQDELAAGDLSTYIWLQLGMGAFALLLWVYDGAPVARECLRGIQRFLLQVVRRNADQHDR